MSIALHHGDCLDVMKTLEPDSVDTIITDPPYGLEFMGKDWDHGIPGVAFWKEALRIAKPGALLLAFGGTRTHHRLMVAIEDAGWEIRDCLMWLYGSGFPKSHNISKAIDKAAGAEREVVGTVRRWGNAAGKGRGGQHANGYEASVLGAEKFDDITAPATDDAKLWDGYGTALKPAWEPIILAMKPLDGTFANNAIEHGVAGIWVDGGRIPTNGETPTGSGDRRGSAIYAQDEWTQKHMANGGNATPPSGRFPANLILSHHPDCGEIGTRQVDGSGHWPKTRGGGSQTCGASGHTGQADLEEKHARGETVPVWDCVEDCPVRLLDEQSGTLQSGKAPATGFVRHSDKHRNSYAPFAGNKEEPTVLYGDTGGASRFFYCAKASRRERTCNGTIENKHPTVKPLALMRYLVRLTRTPTGGTVLDMFAGSGSTPCACIPEGRDCIAIEKDLSSFETMQARVEWTEAQPEQLSF